MFMGENKDAHKFPVQSFVRKYYCGSIRIEGMIILKCIIVSGYGLNHIQAADSGYGVGSELYENLDESSDLK
jgi:hypothetical protein